MKKFIMMMALAITAGVYTAQAQDVITDPAAAAQAQKDFAPAAVNVISFRMEFIRNEFIEKKGRTG